MYRIPLFDLNFDRKEEKAVIKTLRSKWISTGPKTAEFEAKFSSLLDVKYSLALSNCTSALHLAMVILNISKGDEVICPSLTFMATVNSIRYVNATPVFCDINSLDDLTIDPVQIEKLVTKKTKAIVVMHYAGFPCQMNKILKIAKEHNLFIIEDACHGPLSEYKGKKLGTIGDAGAFSFFSNKNISTGEGGMLVTNNINLYEKAKLLRSHGMTTLSYDRAKGHNSLYDVTELGYNYRIDDIRASIGIVQLDKLKKDLIKRAGIRKLYINKLKGLNSIIIPFLNNKEFVSNYIFTIILKNSDSEKRNIVRNYLYSKGIQTSVHYIPVHKFDIYSKFKKSLPITDYIGDNLITLPMYGRLTKENVKYICVSLKEALKSI